MAVQADPDDASLHEARAEVYAARAEAEPSLMATGVFKWAADESRRATGRPETATTVGKLIS
jgi:hypothetical protein